MPITGYDIEERKQYAERVKNKIQQRFMFAQVITPFDICQDTSLPYSKLMGMDIEKLLECNAICMTHRWSFSKGCRVEKYIASTYGKTIMFLNDKKGHFWLTKECNYGKKLKYSKEKE